MRIKNSMRNMIYIYGCTLLVAVLNFVVRRIFLDILTVDYLGYDGLFTSIFSFLSLSEMGIASIITYHMYSEIAAQNTFQIRKLLYIYKLIYRVVGFFVLAAGAVAGLFLPIILKNSFVTDWLFTYTIYFLQLMATLCTYFLAYRRILFITHQRIYVCTAVDTVINVVAVLAKMTVLLVFRNYIIYLLIAIVSNVLSNAIISYLSRKDYPEITPIDVTKEDMKELNLFKDVKNMLVTKLATVLYGSSDDIVITSILGLHMSGLISNYRMLTGKITELILSMFNSLQASIGNLVYDKDEEKGKGFFYALDMLGFFMGIVCATGVISIGQPFILLWLKEESYLLPNLFLYLMGINLFIALCNNPINYFRNSLGHFETDRNYMIAAAAINILLSIILVFPMGISGIMIGTVAGHILIYLGRIIVVHRYFLKESPIPYCFKFLFRAVLLAGSLILSLIIGNIISETFDSLLVIVLLRGIIGVAISGLLSIAFSFRSEAFKVILQYVTTVLNMILKRNATSKNRNPEI